uniref:FAD binding domain-containing protein n=1 Tax=Acinetobacter baumannii TaxID=470 RepID=UPI0020905EAA
VWYRPTDIQVSLPDMCTDATGRQHGLAIPPPLIRPDVVARLRADAHALLPPQIADVVGQARQPFFQPIYDLESPRLA